MSESQTALGKYRVLKELGRGSFGVVYLAEDTSLRDRRVALKVLFPQLVVDPATLMLFQQEAGTMAQLEHPHIVPVYEAGEFEGRRFIAMRFMVGRTLGDVVKAEGPQPLERVGQWLAQIASAMDYAHRRGVLHRDVKPSNIMLDDEGRAMLTDFGLAKAVNASGGSASAQEQQIMAGTARYMAPEQARGNPVPQSDLYSLGVVVYELLTGRVPFDGTDPFAIAFQHVSDPPRPPRQFRPDLPAAVEGVILQSLAKDPAGRFHTAGAMANAFRQALESVARARAEGEQRSREAAAEDEHRRRVAEEQARREESERARRAEEERQRLAAQEQARREATERARREQEERRRLAADEQARRETAERVRRAEEERQRLVAAERQRALDEQRFRDAEAARAYPVVAPAPARKGGRLKWVVVAAACLTVVIVGTVLLVQALRPARVVVSTPEGPIIIVVTPEPQVTDAWEPTPTLEETPWLSPTVGVVVGKPTFVVDEGTPTPVVSEVPRGDILLYDGFDDPTQWPTYALYQSDYDQAALWVGEGAYSIWVKAGPWTAFGAYAGASYSDFVLEVDATLALGTDTREVALVFRADEQYNYYQFGVSDVGQFHLQLYYGGQWYSLWDWTSSPAIFAGDATNHLAVVCSGPAIHLFVNDVYLGSVEDGTLPAGTIGMLATTFGTDGALGVFDDLVVYSLP